MDKCARVNAIPVDGPIFDLPMVSDRDCKAGGHRQKLPMAPGPTALL